jgi:hypothetical protein
MRKGGEEGAEEGMRSMLLETSASLHALHLSISLTLPFSPSSLFLEA